MASYYYLLKKYVSGFICTLYINGNANNRTTTEVLLTNPSMYRAMQFQCNNTIPDGYKFVRPGDTPIRFFKSVNGQVSFETSGTYESEKAKLENYLANGDIVEITFSEFSTAFNYSISTDLPERYFFNYTTPASDANDTTWIMLYPNEYLFRDVTYYNLTTQGTHCSVTPSTSTLESGTVVNVTITPDTGYSLDVPTVTGTTIAWTQVGDTLEGSFTIESDVTITATATAIPCTITTTGAHCTFSPASYTGAYGDVVSVTVTPDAGYEFTDASQIAVTGASITWAFSQGVATGSLTLVQDVIISATPSIIVIRHTLTATGTNCTISPSSGTYEEGTQITIRATANTGWAFKDSSPTTTGSVIWEKVNGEWIGEAVFLSDIMIEATAYRVSSVTYNLTDATATPDQSTVYMYGDTVDITVTADAGMYFDTAPLMRYQDNYLNWVNVTLTPVDATAEYKKVYNFTLTIDAVDNNFRNATLIAVAQAQPLIDDFGVFNIYNPTLAQLKAIADKRYSFTEDNTYYIDKVDLGDFVLSLLRVYVPFTTGPDAIVMLGGYNTEVQAKSVTYPYTTVDCGSVTIPLVYDSEMDYNYTAIRMFIPFYGFTELPTDRYMGKTITLVYECELITGKAIAQLIVNNEVLDIFDCRIATEVPYILSLDKGIHGNYDINTFALIDTVPFIEVYRNMEYSTDEIRGKNNTYKLISTLSGYQELNIVPVGIGATATEVSRIVALCREGVIL